MNRPSITLLSSALLTTLFCALPLACDATGNEKQAPDTRAAASEPAADATPEVRESASAAASEQGEGNEVRSGAGAIEDQAVLASVATPRFEPSSSEVMDAPSATTLTRRERAPDSLRSPKLLPAGTPEASIVAFTRLPLGKRDKAPVSGIGASGIHLDELEIGKGWASSRCEELGDTFTVDSDARVNVCFRVVHPRVAETVSLEWAHAGTIRQIIHLDVKATHAYLTRAWLPVTEGRAGEWTATVKSDDGAVLGQMSFEISA